VPDNGDPSNNVEEYATHVVNRVKDIGVLGAAKEEADRIGSELPGRLSESSLLRAVLEFWDEVYKYLPLNLRMQMAASVRELKAELDKSEGLHDGSSCVLLVKFVRSEPRTHIRSQPEAVPRLIKIDWQADHRVVIEIDDRGLDDNEPKVLLLLLSGSEESHHSYEWLAKVLTELASSRERAAGDLLQRTACVLFRITTVTLVGTISGGTAALVTGDKLASELLKALVTSALTAFGLEAVNVSGLETALKESFARKRDESAYSRERPQTSGRSPRRPEGRPRPPYSDAPKEASGRGQSARSDDIPEHAKIDSPLIEEPFTDRTNRTAQPDPSEYPLLDLVRETEKQKPDRINPHPQSSDPDRPQRDLGRDDRQYRGQVDQPWG
jgi:hypothetical protein